MFVYSLKASTVRFFGIILLSVTALVTMIAFVPTYAPTAADTAFSRAVSIRFDSIRTNEDRIAFLAQFGWEVDPTPVEEVQVRLPADFDKIFIRYNNLQKQQGLDLGRYRRKNVTRVTYKILNYPDFDGEVLANLLLYRGKVIGGDVCSSDAEGFVFGFDGICRP